MNCTQCGHPLESHHRFCEECGATRPQLPPKFAAAQQAYLELKGRYARGEMTEAEFEAAMQNLTVQDADGFYWMLGAESGQWYRYDGQQWLQTNPPLIAAAPPVSPPPPMPPPVAAALPPTAAAPPAKKSNWKRWLALLVLAILIGIVGVVVGRYIFVPSDSGQEVATGSTLTPTALNANETELPVTPGTATTPASTSSSTPTTGSEIDLMATPSATAVSSDPDSTSTPAGPTSSPTSRPATATPTITPTQTPTAGPPVIGPFLDFESDLVWRRGDQPYGEFDRSDEETMEGESAGRLDYDFPAVTENFVVFEAQPEFPLPEETTGILAWVNGDGSGHYLNIWLRDAEGERTLLHIRADYP